MSLPWYRTVLTRIVSFAFFYSHSISIFISVPFVCLTEYSVYPCVSGATEVLCILASCSAFKASWYVYHLGDSLSFPHHGAFSPFKLTSRDARFATLRLETSSDDLWTFPRGSVIARTIRFRHFSQVESGVVFLFGGDSYGWCGALYLGPVGRTLLRKQCNFLRYRGRICVPGRLTLTLITGIYD